MFDYAGGELEADFHRHWGIDVLDFFRGRLPWGKFFRLVELLPTASHYRDKLLRDEELAAALEDVVVDDDCGEVDLPFHQETVVVGLLRDLRDRLDVLTWVQGGSSKNPPAPGPRPRTAVDRIGERRQEAEFLAVLDEVADGGWF